MSHLTPEERYGNKVDRSGGPHACWPWKGHCNRKGYGKFSPKASSPVIASRFGWEMHHGPIPEGLKVLHTCDNPPCQNPAHWFLGTDGDNMRDKMAKGRGTPPPLHQGEAQHCAVLNETKVRTMRARAARGESIAALAREYGVSKTAAQRAVKRMTWKHVS